MTNMNVGFSREVIKQLRARGADNNLFHKLADTVINIPRNPKFKVDASDNAITVYGHPVSILRDHTKGEAFVMTIREAEQLDAYSLKGKKWLVRI